MAILLTGGAGYIGSITNKVLREEGYETVIFDNLFRGHKEALGNTHLVVGDLRNPADLKKVFSEHHIDAVIHFAALALAGESVQKPAEYFEVNIDGTRNLLDAMAAHQCPHIVFSSTCAVYGTPKSPPVSERTPIAPESPYGTSKRKAEELIIHYEKTRGITSIILRYFNACGAALDGSLGEHHDPETHIIPTLLDVALGKKNHFDLYGTDYATKDGTCVRDYIHVLDLADAHSKGLSFLKKQDGSEIFNLGTGHGYSNQEVISMVESVTKRSIAMTHNPRRPGDPAAIWADSRKANTTLGWQPRYSDLNTIIASAWKWHTR